jgi:hypothetical protein
MQLRKKMRIDIGKYNFNIDGDENLSSLVLALKKDYESLETQVKNFTLQKDENFACTVGEQEMEYPMDSKGFARFKKDMDKYYKQIKQNVMLKKLSVMQNLLWKMLRKIGLNNSKQRKMQWMLKSKY